MIRKFMMTAAAAAFMTATAFAQTTTTTTQGGNGPYGGRAHELGVNVSGILFDNDSLDETASVSGRYLYRPPDWPAIGLGGEVGYIFESDVEGLSVGAIQGVPLLADVQLTLPLDWAVQPYALLGLGVIFWDEEDTTAVEFDGDAAFTAKIAAGLDWFVAENTALNLEVAYVASDADFVRSTFADDEDVDHVQLGGGVKFFF